MILVRPSNFRGPPAHLLCPRCKTEGTATVTDHREQATLLLLVPLFTKTTTYVTCDRCKTRFVSKFRMAKLALLDNDDVSPYLRGGPSAPKPVWLMLTMIGVMLLSIVPVGGIFVATTSLIFTRRYLDWRWTISLIALSESVVATVIFLMPLLDESPRHYFLNIWRFICADSSRCVIALVGL